MVAHVYTFYPVYHIYQQCRDEGPGRLFSRSGNTAFLFAAGSYPGRVLGDF